MFFNASKCMYANFNSKTKKLQSLRRPNWKNILKENFSKSAQNQMNSMKKKNVLTKKSPKLRGKNKKNRPDHTCLIHTYLRLHRNISRPTNFCFHSLPPLDFLDRAIFTKEKINNAASKKKRVPLLFFFSFKFLILKKNLGCFFLSKRCQLYTFVHYPRPAKKYLRCFFVSKRRQLYTFLQCPPQAKQN
jgi:hypothetical protein